MNGEKPKPPMFQISMSDEMASMIFTFLMKEIHGCRTGSLCIQQAIENTAKSIDQLKSVIAKEAHNKRHSQ
jgi:hypothetical protein